MNEDTRFMAKVLLLIMASALLVWGILLAYTTSNLFVGLMIVLVGWVLLSLIKSLAKGARA